jgi:hypothetical protein
MDAILAMMDDVSAEQDDGVPEGQGGATTPAAAGLAVLSAQQPAACASPPVPPQAQPVQINEAFLSTIASVVRSVPFSATKC